MYYFRKNGCQKILHTGTCRYKAAIQADHLDTATDVNEAVAAGYRFCKCCDPLGRRFQVERQEMLGYLQQHGLSVYRHRRGVGVATPRSRWMIVYVGNKIGTTLYNRNDLHRKGNADGPYPGYHAQKVCYADLHGYLEYIVGHDYDRMMHTCYPAPAKKAPPPKGSKRYKKAQKRQKNKSAGRQSKMYWNWSSRWHHDWRPSSRYRLKNGDLDNVYTRYRNCDRMETS